MNTIGALVVFGMGIGASVLGAGFGVLRPRCHMTSPTINTAAAAMIASKIGLIPPAGAISIVNGYCALATSRYSIRPSRLSWVIQTSMRKSCAPDAPSAGVKIHDQVVVREVMSLACV